MLKYKISVAGTGYYDPLLTNVPEKIYTRDLFGRD